MASAVLTLPARSTYVANITLQWRKSVEGILNCGRLLQEAFESLPVGEYAIMVESELPFGERAAQTLRQIAAHPVLSDPQHVALLPAAWGTLAALVRLPEGVLEKALEEGKINPDMDRVQVHRLNPAAERTVPVQFACPFCGSERTRLIDSEPTGIEHAGVSFYHQALYACRECERITHCATAILGEYHKRYIAKDGL